MSFPSNVNYYVDDDSVLHVEVDGVEIGTESGCDSLSKQGIHDIVYNLLEEYGYL